MTLDDSSPRAHLYLADRTYVSSCKKVLSQDPEEYSSPLSQMAYGIILTACPIGHPTECRDARNERFSWTICPKFAIQIRLGIWPPRVQREEIMVDWSIGETYVSLPANSCALNVEANSEIGSKLGKEGVKMGYLWCELPLGTLRVARMEIRIHFPGDCAKNNSTVRIFCPNYAKIAIIWCRLKPIRTYCLREPRRVNRCMPSADSNFLLKFEALPVKTKEDPLKAFDLGPFF